MNVRMYLEPVKDLLERGPHKSECTNLSILVVVVCLVFGISMQWYFPRMHASQLLCSLGGVGIPVTMSR
jgi:hypothetical protein